MLLNSNSESTGTSGIAAKWARQGRGWNAMSEEQQQLHHLHRMGADRRAEYLGRLTVAQKTRIFHMLPVSDQQSTLNVMTLEEKAL